ncbi:MAG TPA: glycosyltransferase [Acidobacteriota bacterium]|nr:glycosyltransferase [Acidobacteriota bacterium]
MRKEARILYSFDPENTFCKNFVETLRKALTGWDITLGAPGLMTRLFEVRKYNLIHSFHAPEEKAAGFVKALPDNVRKVQTLLGPPAKPEAYRKLIVGHRAVVFSRTDRDLAQKTVPGTPVDWIPPCSALPDMNLLQPSSQVRDSFQVGDRFMVVALCDISSKEDFDNFIYVTREYNRRGEFRFLLPRFIKDKDTLLWRDRIRVMIEQERLTCATLLDQDVDLHSLLDAADMAVYLRKGREPGFDFSLHVLEAINLGKPVLCYNIPPYNETLKEFAPAWSCTNTEEVVRESQNLRKSAAQIEQISTDMARFARDRFSADKIAAQYRAIYETALKSL